MSTIPLVMTAAGPVATDPTTLRQNLIDSVAAEVPDYTANLPGSLIEDVASTDVGALTTIDQARVEAVRRFSSASRAAPHAFASRRVRSTFESRTPPT
ncbi:hypothetical protein QZM53_07870 [Burkholderia multivorans]|nr:hypothetical protein [Burkholderia multivorans]MDN7405365.1 hypothetical protein [Burkholderia multivorans]MDN7414743.1 hypothetical protein [Burkholderia multivorans]MDN7648022.1 hypothetical protein [Burkholderia multivorans]MDN7685073.1 hypothetical protein [Burkholderia multivorans]